MEIKLDDLDLDMPSLEDRVFELIADKLAKKVEDRLNDRISGALSKMLEEETVRAAKRLVDAMLDDEFVEVSSWGSKGEKTTIRSRIASSFQKMMEFRDSHYDSERSPFAKFMRNEVDKCFQAAKPELLKKVDAEFTAKCFEYARAETAKKLGLTEK